MNRHSASDMNTQTARKRTDTADSTRLVEVLDSEHLPTREILPPWLSPAYLHLPQDELESETSIAQQKTQAECLPLLELDNTQGLPLNSHDLPHLKREAHVVFLKKALHQYPAAYMAMDASRPWFFYWALQGLTALGQDVSEYKQQLIDTLRPLQNVSGGFAGGHGQYSHCATTYACVLALVMVDGQHMIDRTAMWHFLGQMKQEDGGFRVADMAEQDIRGAYCAMTIIALLNLQLDLPADAPARKAGLTTFADGLGDWIGRCQTFEGGIAGAPTFEAHGAYAFCALACLCILDAPSRSIPTYLDIDALTRWMAEIQTTPEGGFAGRTNKLVDACYSHWVGGSWALLEAAREKAQTSCWNRAALIRYLLTCCQQPGKKGGMRDKPSARPDAYHTCYALAGMSAAEHSYDSSESRMDQEAYSNMPAPFRWTVKAASMSEQSDILIDTEEMIAPVHPVFVMPFAAVARAQQYFTSLDHAGQSQAGSTVT